jgi:hypothetical protein
VGNAPHAWHALTCGVTQPACLSCRYDSDDYSQFQVDQKTGDDWRKVYSTPEKHPCYDPSKVPNQYSFLREGCYAVDPTHYTGHAPCS